MAEEYSGTVKCELGFRELELGDTPGEIENAGHQLDFCYVRRSKVERLLRQHGLAVKDAISLEVEVPAHA